MGLILYITLRGSA